MVWELVEFKGYLPIHAPSPKCWAWGRCIGKNPSLKSIDKTLDKSLYGWDNTHLTSRFYKDELDSKFQQEHTLISFNKRVKLEKVSLTFLLYTIILSGLIRGAAPGKLSCMQKTVTHTTSTTFAGDKSNQSKLCILPRSSPSINPYQMLTTFSFYSAIWICVFRLELSQGFCEGLPKCRFQFLHFSRGFPGFTPHKFYRGSCPCIRPNE